MLTKGVRTMSELFLKLMTLWAKLPDKEDRDIIVEAKDRISALEKELRELLREAYGYTTAADSLLPERIRAALQEQDNE